jgi:predicted ArsR family transcriptional regulator
MNLNNNPTVTALSNERKALVIKTIKRHQALTIPDIAIKLGLNATTVRNIVHALCDAKKLILVDPTRTRHQAYRIRTQADEAVSQIQKRYKPEGIFTGLRWEPSANRPGCEDFLRLKSRFGDTLVDYRAPIYGATPSHEKAI